MKRFKYFSAEDARRLADGEVSEVVVSDDTTILFNSNKFWYKQNGDEYDCDVPHSYITDGDYDAAQSYGDRIPHGQMAGTYQGLGNGTQM